jgi:hypothetical protein
MALSWLFSPGQLVYQTFSDVVFSIPNTQQMTWQSSENNLEHDSSASFV